MSVGREWRISIANQIFKISFLFLVCAVLNTKTAEKQQKTTNQRQKQNHNSATLNCLLFVLIAFSIAQINDTPQARAMFLTDSSDIY